MVQSILPDLNSKFILYTREAINAWKNQNYDSAIGSLNAFNGLLPETETPGKYRVLVDTQEYERRTKQDLVMFCKYCEPDIYKDDRNVIDWNTVKTVNYHTTKILKVMPVLAVRVLTGLEYEEIWYCKECNKENYIKETIMLQRILKDPSFIAIVPKPPNKNNGIIDRSQFYTKFSVWFWTFLTELEAQGAKYRQEYVPKTGEEQEQIVIEDSGEESD